MLPCLRQPLLRRIDAKHDRTALLEMQHPASRSACHVNHPLHANPVQEATQGPALNAQKRILHAVVNGRPEAVSFYGGNTLHRLSRRGLRIATSFCAHFSSTGAL